MEGIHCSGATQFTQTLSPQLEYSCASQYVTQHVCSWRAKCAQMCLCVSTLKVSSLFLCMSVHVCVRGPLKGMDGKPSKPKHKGCSYNLPHLGSARYSSTSAGSASHSIRSKSSKVGGKEGFFPDTGSSSFTFSTSDAAG